MFAAHRDHIYRNTDRMFAALMVLQWIAGIVAACFISPRTWIGQTSHVHVHVWAAIFLGTPTRAQPPPVGLVAPVAALGACVVIAGLWPEPVASLAAAAGESSVRAPTAAEVAYHLDARAENLMALAAWGLGLTLLAGPVLWRRVAGAVAEAGSRTGPERLYVDALHLLNRLSDQVHDLEVRDLRARVAAVLVPAGVLVLIGFLATPTAGLYRVGDVVARDIGLVLMLALACVAAVAATLPRKHLTLALVLATLGFPLAAVYAFFGAPDVALVAVVVETLLALLVFGVLALVPAEVLRREAGVRTRGSRRWRDPLIGVLAGALTFVLAWGALSRPAPERSVAAEHIARAPDAHAKDVVTAILADFRGLDTMGEVTVVAVGLIGVVALLRRGRLW
jgi:multicomponent Na+:H+ antiporter subunit A